MFSDPAPSVVPTTVPVPPAVPRAATPPPARYTEPVQVYRCSPVPPQPPVPPAPVPEGLVDYAPHVRYVYERRSKAPPPPPPSPEPSPPPPTLTPPPPPPPHRSRVELTVYHPPVIHRDPRHTHPMVTRQAAGVLRHAALSATEGEPRLSPIPT
jgi:hypothetical protein